MNTMSFLLLYPYLFLCSYRAFLLFNIYYCYHQMHSTKLHYKFCYMFRCLDHLQGAYILCLLKLRNIKIILWVPVTTAWRVLGLRMEERPPIWRVAANKSNKQSRTADRGWSSSLGVGRGANNASPWKTKLLQITHGRDASSGGRCLWVQQWTFGFHKMRGISWLAAKPVNFSRRTLLHGVSK